jgi:hypothetical protein
MTEQMEVCKNETGMMQSKTKIIVPRTVNIIHWNNKPFSVRNFGAEKNEYTIQIC